MPEIIETLLDALLDTLKAAPILFLVYMLLEYLNRVSGKKKFSSNTLWRCGPVIGAGLGLIPQCGFSAAAAELFNGGLLSAGALIAVFLATSDEALPVMLSAVGTDVGLKAMTSILPLLICKFVFAVTAGYLVNLIFCKKPPVSAEEVNVEYGSCEVDEHHCHKEEHHHSVWEFLLHALYHTARICLFLFITTAVINLIFYFIGEDNVTAFLQGGGVFMPFITAAAGLIPGCTVSVALTEIFLRGGISFGSVIAGLSAGAGFGYVVLFKNKSKKQVALVMVLTYVLSALLGMAINLIGIF
ncbi:MAG: arsenic efflux protein [Oscillospiraceae bacterium]|nr:arsenic efflux protein [Candidatus Equicaccousia limihippi]